MTGRKSSRIKRASKVPFSEMFFTKVVLLIPLTFCHANHYHWSPVSFNFSAHELIRELSIVAKN